MAAPPPMLMKTAREILGVGPFYSASDLRRAFREAAKRAHPDRPGGDDARFRQVTEAYHKLQAALPGARGAPSDPIFQPPAPAATAGGMAVVKMKPDAKLRTKSHIADDPAM